MYKPMMKVLVQCATISSRVATHYTLTNRQLTQYTRTRTLLEPVDRLNSLICKQQ